MNIHPQAGKDDVKGEGCNAGGAHDNLREGGLEERGLYTVPSFVKLPLPIHLPSLILQQSVWQGSEYLTLHLKETYSTSGDISDPYLYNVYLVKKALF